MWGMIIAFGLVAFSTGIRWGELGRGLFGFHIPSFSEEPAAVGVLIAGLSAAVGINMVFLYHLSDLSGMSTYKDLADGMVNNVLHKDNYWAHNNENHALDDEVPGCTATELRDAIKSFRAWAGDPSGIVAWDLFHFVEAATIAGETQFASDMAGNTNAPVYMIAEKGADMILGKVNVTAEEVAGANNT